MTAPTNNPIVLEPSQVHQAPPRISPEIIQRFLALADLSGTISDVLDKLGIRGTLGSSILIPTLPSKRVVGAAVTVRNIPQRESSFRSVGVGINRMAEVEGIRVGEPGDVLVIQGLPDISNMGGIMATLANRQKLAGAVVDGGIRDVGQSRSLGFPVWSTSISPVTGKWRCKTEEVNGTVHIADIQVKAGDLVVADETGTCFVPREDIERVLEMSEAITRQEAQVVHEIDGGMSIDDVIRKLFGK
jgi:4-hydroxy-4-methyl-2-oxoglutarate aldolase